MATAGTGGDPAGDGRALEPFVWGRAAFRQAAIANAVLTLCLVVAHAVVGGSSSSSNRPASCEVGPLETWLSLVEVRYATAMVSNAWLTRVWADGVPRALQSTPARAGLAVRNIASTIALVLLVIGNVVVLSSASCSGTQLRSLAVGVLILSYIETALPLLLLALLGCSVFCCMPWLMRVLNIEAATLDAAAAAAAGGGGGAMPWGSHGIPPVSDTVLASVSSVFAMPDPRDVPPGVELSCTICVGRHVFHKDCIDPWLKNYNGSCPVCRTSVRPPVPAAARPAAGPPPGADSPAPRPQRRPSVGEGGQPQTMRLFAVRVV